LATQILPASQGRRTESQNYVRLIVVTQDVVTIADYVQQNSS